MTKLLLDTHALLWWLAEPDRLSPAAHAAISDPANAVYVSAASGVDAHQAPAPGDLARHKCFTTPR
jgi:PIN domain nuclease of toxin-antitoxin system